MTQMTKSNATQMTAFWTAYWAAKASNNQTVMAAAKRMMDAAAKHRPANEEDWAVMATAVAANQA
jgi:hypothetical protein